MKLGLYWFDTVRAEDEFGIEYMARVNVDYQSDQQLMAKFFQFVQCESMLMDEVENDPEVLEELHQLQTTLSALVRIQC